MKDIAIYGFGGFGHEVSCLIHHINRTGKIWNLIGFFDDGVAPGNSCKYGKVLGDLSILNTWKSPLSIVIAIGNVDIIKNLSQSITNPLVDFPNLIAPNVFFFDQESVTLGKGNIITFGCRMSCNISIGNFNIFNGCVSLGHDVVVGNNNLFFPETRISGQTVLGDYNYFGSKTFVSQCLKIGNHNRFAAGSIVLRNTKDNHLYMGNPAKKIEI